MDDRLREHLHERNEAIHQIPDPNSNLFNLVESSKKLPAQVHLYHTLCPLEVNSERQSNVFGYHTMVYKAIRSTDGKPYILRRIENFVLGNEASIGCIESWRRVRHPGIVSVYEAFTTKAFGDTSLMLVYDFHPLSTTLAEKYFSWKEGGPQAITETVLWSLICQLTAAIKAIHSSNLSARVIEPSKIILTGKNRVRLNCVGIMDILTFDPTKPLLHQQVNVLM